MTSKDLLVSQMDASRWLFEQFTRDFSNEDAAFQPFEGGNHLNWMLVHLATTADWVISLLGSTPKKLSDDLHKNYGGGSQCRADDGMTRAEAWKIFSETHTRAVDFVKNFDDARLDDTAPPDVPPICQKVGHVLGLLGTHPFWHFGQLSVNRRMLKKPPAFGA